jgi:hypothetical protein
MADAIPLLFPHKLVDQFDAAGVMIRFPQGDQPRFGAMGFKA